MDQIQTNSMSSHTQYHKLIKKKVNEWSTQQNEYTWKIYEAMTVPNPRPHSSLQNINHCPIVIIEIYRASNIENLEEKIRWTYGSSSCHPKASPRCQPMPSSIALIPIPLLQKLQRLGWTPARRTHQPPLCRPVSDDPNVEIWVRRSAMTYRQTFGAWSRKVCRSKKKVLELQQQRALGCWRVAPRFHFVPRQSKTHIKPAVNCCMQRWESFRRGCETFSVPNHW